MYLLALVLQVPVDHISSLTASVQLHQGFGGVALALSSSAVAAGNAAVFVAQGDLASAVFQCALARSYALTGTRLALSNPIGTVSCDECIHMRIT